jgi:putative peptidoglycan lipid II flippase
MASSLGMTLSAVVLGVLVRRSWGDAALAGLGRSVGVSIVALALGLAGASAMTNGWPLDGWLPAIGTGVVSGLVAVMLGLLVLSIGDRSTFGGVLARGRAARRRRKKPRP